MKPGTRVRFGECLKAKMKTSRAHVREFGGCEGVVIGLVDFGSQVGPEVDVRWEPSGLKYMYDPDDLDIVS